MKLVLQKEWNETCCDPFYITKFSNLKLEILVEWIAATV